MSARLLVQKYGGLALATESGRAEAVERIVETTRTGAQVVAVVSAIGREGDPYATDTLLRVALTFGDGVDPRTLDLLLSCGEVISTALVTHLLGRAGCPAVALTGAQAGIVTTGQFGDARIVRIDPSRIQDALSRGVVPVVAGFQGTTDDGEITTLGRGGSDTTAVAVGAALGADLVEIYKDVDGIMTADPRLVPSARPIPAASYDEVSQMAYLGARVLHPRAADIGREHGVRLVVRRLGGGGGTVIMAGNELGVPIVDGHPVIGLAHLPDVAQITLADGGGLDRPLAALEAVAEAGISIDLITLMPDVLVFTVARGNAEHAREVLRQAGFEPRITDPCAKVSIIGAGIRGVPGIMARVVGALRRSEVTILQTADSHTTISCLVPASQMRHALVALHEEFGLGAQVESVREAAT